MDENRGKKEISYCSAVQEQLQAIHNRLVPLQLLSRTLSYETHPNGLDDIFFGFEQIITDCLHSIWEIRWSLDEDKPHLDQKYWVSLRAENTLKEIRDQIWKARREVCQKTL